MKSALKYTVLFEDNWIEGFLIKLCYVGDDLVNDKKRKVVTLEKISNGRINALDLRSSYALNQKNAKKTTNFL